MDSKKVTFNLPKKNPVHEGKILKGVSFSLEKNEIKLKNNDKKDSFFLPSNNNVANHKKYTGRYKEKGFQKQKVEEHEQKVKKPFDKKTYRLKKYSNKYKLDQWEEQRKKKMLRDYYKSVNNEIGSSSYKLPNLDEGHGQDIEPGRFVRHPSYKENIKNSQESNTDSAALENSSTKNHDTDLDKKKDPYWKAKEHYNKIKEEKINKKAEIIRASKERKQKLLEYKTKKAEKWKKLSRKTKRGQPVMSYRLENLMEKITSSENQVRVSKH